MKKMFWEDSLLAPCTVAMSSMMLFRIKYFQKFATVFIQFMRLWVRGGIAIMGAGWGLGGGAQKTFYSPYDMVYWLPDLTAP